MNTNTDTSYQMDDLQFAIDNRDGFARIAARAMARGDLAEARHFAARFAEAEAEVIARRKGGQS